MWVYPSVISDIMRIELTIKKKQNQPGSQSDTSFSAKETAHEDTNSVNNKGRTNVKILVRVVTLGKRIALSRQPKKSVAIDRKTRYTHK